MKRDFTENEIKTIYQAMKDGRRKREVMKLMNFTEEEFSECFHQARLKFSKPVKAPRDKPSHDFVMGKPKECVVKPNDPFKRPKACDVKQNEPFKRPKAEYSNRSPYGIARPGINR